MSVEEQVIDAESTEVGTDVVPAAAATVATPVKAADLVERLATIREAADNAMEKDVDYGVIPGTNKPTLLKPGAEKLGVLFQLDAQTTHEERWAGDHLTVNAKTIVYHSPTGARLGSGEGMCSTRERKYAYRKQERTCPACNVAAIIKGKAEYGGGWVCFKKKGGCGAKFSDGSQEIEGQQVGEIDNPDLPDSWNTVVKMARKRALVDAVLLVTGASALFTQDVEDSAPAAEPPSEHPYGPPASEKQGDSMMRALGYLIGRDPGDMLVTKGAQKLKAHFNGYYPEAAVWAVAFTAGHVRKWVDTVPPGDEPDRTSGAEIEATEAQAQR